MKDEQEKTRQMTITDIFDGREVDIVSIGASDDLNHIDLEQETKPSKPKRGAKVKSEPFSSEVMPPLLRQANLPEGGLNTKQTELDFETALSELEKVVAALDGEVKLERALQLFEQGMKLSNECEKFLKVAEQRVEILKQTLDGTITAEPFKAPLLDSLEG